MDELFFRNKQKLEVIDKPEYQAATLGPQVMVVYPDNARTFMFQYDGLQCVPGGLGIAIE